MAINPNKPNLSIVEPPKDVLKAPLSRDERVKRFLKTGVAVVLAAGSVTYGADKLLNKEPTKGETPNGPQWSAKELSKFPAQLQKTVTVEPGDGPRAVGEKLDPGVYQGPNSDPAQAAELDKMILKQAQGEYLQSGQTVTGPEIAKYQDPPTSAPVSK